jgi:hypothetical protein
MMNAMMRKILPPAALFAVLAMAQSTNNIPERLAKWKRVEMPFQTAGLSQREIQRSSEMGSSLSFPLLD